MTITTAFRSLQHLFFPHTCAGCGNDAISPHHPICLHCTSILPLTGFHEHADNPVENIFRGRLPLAAAMSYCWFSKESLVQHLLHELKYKNNKQIGIHFGRRIGEALKQSPRFQTIDAILPIPLHAARERQRGYNQATQIATGIAATMQLPVLVNTITRASNTSSQTKRNRLQRWQNMEDKFHLRQPEALTGKHLLLVDDVITTGATLEACGRALLSAGRVTLSIATLAITAR